MYIPSGAMDGAMGKLSISGDRDAPAPSAALRLAARRVRTEYDACVRQLLLGWKLPEDLVVHIERMIYAGTPFPWVAAADYAAAMSAMASARDMLRQLDRRELFELKMFNQLNQPPQSAHTLAEVLCILLGRRGIRARVPDHFASSKLWARGVVKPQWSFIEDFWRAFVELCAQPDMGLVAELLAHDRDRITDEVADRVRPYLSDPDLTMEKLRLLPRACTAVMCWVRATMLYHDTCIVAYERDRDAQPQPSPGCRRLHRWTHESVEHAERVRRRTMFEHGLD